MNYTPIFNTSDFYGGFYWVKEIIDKQNSNTKNNEMKNEKIPLQIFENCGREI
jgi:uncharacterized protein Smg (DUF494 family)